VYATAVPLAIASETIAPAALARVHIARARAERSTESSNPRRRRSVRVVIVVVVDPARARLRQCVTHPGCRKTVSHCAPYERDGTRARAVARRRR
jgi:hypothetical protein